MFSLPTAGSRRREPPFKLEQPHVSTDAPRPPEGDWLGTPYLRFERRGPIAVCTVDRPEKRNAMTPGHVLRRPLRGRPREPLRRARRSAAHRLGRRVHPRRRSERRQHRRLGRPADAAGDGQHAVRRHPQLAQAGGVRGQRHRPGWRLDDGDAERRHRGVGHGHLPFARAVPRHRRHELRADPAPPDRPGPGPRHAVDRPHRHRRPRPSTWGLVARVVPPERAHGRGDGGRWPTAAGPRRRLAPR